MNNKVKSQVVNDSNQNKLIFTFEFDINDLMTLSLNENTMINLQQAHNDNDPLKLLTSLVHIVDQLQVNPGDTNGTKTIKQQ